MSEIKRYTKKPVTVEAIQWTGGNLKDCIDFLGNSYGGHNAERAPNGKAEIKVLTLEGNHIASKGDYIIRGVQGEHYPCKPDIFEKTYATEVTDHTDAIKQARIEAPVKEARTKLENWFAAKVEEHIEQLEKAEGLSKSCDSSHLKESTYE